jgi:hypothetical protein
MCAPDFPQNQFFTRFTKKNFKFRKKSKSSNSSLFCFVSDRNSVMKYSEAVACGGGGEILFLPEAEVKVFRAASAALVKYVNPPRMVTVSPSFFFSYFSANSTGLLKTRTLKEWPRLTRLAVYYAMPRRTITSRLLTLFPKP